MDNVLLHKTKWMKTDFNETQIEPVLACVYCWCLSFYHALHDNINTQLLDVFFFCASG
jgi:hypothetical protein